MWYLISASVIMILLVYREIKIYQENVEQWWISLPIHDKHELVTKYLIKKKYIYQITDSEKRMLYKTYNKDNETNN